MKFENYDIIIMPSYMKESFLLSNLGNHHNIKIMSLNEFRDKYLYTYDDKAVVYLINKYQYTIDITKVYLKNMIKIYNCDNTTDKKVQKIKNIFDELDKQGLIIYNKYFYEYVKDKKILIYQKYLNKEELNFINYLKNNNLDITIYEHTFNNYGIKNIYELDNIENECISFEYENIKYNDVAKIFLGENSTFNTTIFNDTYQSKITGIISEINEDKEYIKLRTNDEYVYYNFNMDEKTNIEILKDNKIFLSKKNGKYGYVDAKGNIVVDYIYDDATEQNHQGFVSVKKNGLWGSLDKDGETIIEPKYNLDNYLLINFIGKWHLGEDINMNYYCEK